jgi:hypothetical protein
LTPIVHDDISFSTPPSPDTVGFDEPSFDGGGFDNPSFDNDCIPVDESWNLSAKRAEIERLQSEHLLDYMNCLLLVGTFARITSMLLVMQDWDMRSGCLGVRSLWSI